ncbi:MAG TPA: carbon-nitrogen hydrolase family protein [Terriglobia bacterium]|nr:carbon-nitrogen hydrolase family protein [Terriglobia bacterium]
MKIAAVQMDVKICDKERNLAMILENLDSAARAGAGIVVFPECALSGYCFNSREEAWPEAETVPGPSTERIAEAASNLGCTAVVGLLERDGEEIYNAAAVITPLGILGTHRKVHLLCLGVDRFDALGDKPFPVFETPHGKVGINICFDCSFPESGRVLKLKGAQLLTIPTNWPAGSDAWAHTCKVRATENHMLVVAADRVGEERGFRFIGHSQIIDYEGRVLAEAGETEETIISAEVELAAADRNRVVRVPGRYEFDRMAARRPEMYGVITERRL